MGLLYVLAASPLFAALDPLSSPRGDRVSNLDGLRGFLAYGVFFHHAVIYHDYLLGNWALPHSRFYTMIGQIAVALFFMISGYLFWGKMIDARGRPRWIRLYVGRIFRIGPLYLFSFAVMLLIVGFRTGFELRVPLAELLDQIGIWSLLGYFGSGPDINAYHDTRLLVAGVYWTLSYEWQFYFSLVVLAIATRDRRFHLPFVAFMLAACVAYQTTTHAPYFNVNQTVCIMLFLSGMLCASLEKCGLILSSHGVIGSIFTLIVLSIVVFSSTSAYELGPMIQIGILFFSIISGASMFGLLSSRPARRLGEMSYSVYLLQGLVLTLFFGVDSIRTFALQSPARYWASVLACSIVLLGVSALTHLWIERVGIEIGKRVAAAVESLFNIRAKPVAPIEEG